MTVSIASTESAGALAAADALDAALQRLRSELAGIGVAAPHIVADSPQEAALLKLLDGVGSESDVVQLGVPLPGARLVVLRTVGGGCRELAGRVARDRDIVAAAHPSGYVVVLARDLPRRAGEDKALRTATRVAADSARSRPGTTAGISARLADATGLPTAWRDATESAELAARTGRDSLCADDVWAELVADRLRRSLASQLPLQHPLQRLADYDDRRGTDFARTVAVWLEHNMDTARTAGFLSLHANTLRYRLRRAGEVSGLDLGDPLHRLVAQLALHSLGSPA